MRKFIITSIISLVFLHLAETQTGAGFPGTLDLYIVPLPLVDRNPRFRLGMEYHTQHHVGYSLEVGYGNSNLNSTPMVRNLWGNTYSFYEIRPEIKWYRKEESHFAAYYSAEIFFQHMNANLEDLYYYPDREFFTLPGVINYTEASFQKAKFGLQAKAGMKFLLVNRFIFDFYGGTGIARRYNSYHDVENPIIRNEHPFEEWLVAPYKHEGNAWLLQISFGMRIGYVIRRL